MSTPEKDPILQVNNLVASAGEFLLSPTNLAIEQGDCLAVMGKSGSGKTTLIEALCGLRPIISGQVTLKGREITHLAPGERSIGLVPQDVALFRSLTVREHLAFGPKLQGWTNSKINERVEDLAEHLDISSLLERKPHGLSGGEAKRVGLGRAISVKPALLCLDEALSGLDDETHERILSLLSSIFRKENLTVLLITHRRREAEALAQAIHRVDAPKKQS